MIDMNIFDTLKKLSLNETIQRKPPMHIYKDEKTGQIIEEPLKDMAASALLNKVNPAKEIHKFMFGY